MKKILLIAMLCLVGCENRVSSTVETSPSGHVNINGKNCSVVMVNVGGATSLLYFIDCGPGSSSVTQQSGKFHQTIGQYNPPATTSSATPEPSVCHCPLTTQEDLKKIQ